jgi:CBS domain-containing protein
VAGFDQSLNDLSRADTEWNARGIRCVLRRTVAFREDVNRFYAGAEDAGDRAGGDEHGVRGEAVVEGCEDNAYRDRPSSGSVVARSVIRARADGFALVSTDTRSKRGKELPVKTTTDRLTVGDAMHRGVVTCDVGTPLSKVAQMMVGHRIHCVVVVDSSEERERAPWGVVSDLDLAAAFANEVEGAAGEIAATPAVTVGVRDPLRRAAQLMTEHGVTHVVVVDPRSTRAAGVLSTLDLARVLADELS